MTIEELPYIMVRSLLGTIIIEVTIATLLKIKNKKDLLNVVLVNVMTNPIVVTLPLMFYRFVSYKSYILSFYILEVLTVIVEGLVYKRILTNKKINPYLLSLILNLSSYLIGELINRI